MAGESGKPGIARRGRPPLTAGEAKRASFNTRLRTGLKNRLEEEARKSGRSLSEEIESRLERSIDGERQLKDALELAFGPQAAALTLLCGFAVSQAATHASTFSGVRLQIGERPWISVPFVFGQAGAAVSDVLRAIEPEGDQALQWRGLPDDLRMVVENLGRGAAGKVCRAVAYPADDGPLGSWAVVIHNWLGSAAIGRIKAALSAPSEPGEGGLK